MTKIKKQDSIPVECILPTWKLYMFQFQLLLDVIPSRVSLPDVTSGEWVSRGVPYQSHDACYIPTHPPTPYPQIETHLWKHYLSVTLLAGGRKLLLPSVNEPWAEFPLSFITESDALFWLQEVRTEFLQGAMRREVLPRSPWVRTVSKTSMMTCPISTRCRWTVSESGRCSLMVCTKYLST